MRYWVWVFGEIEGLRWVLENKRMAFPEHAGSMVGATRRGDRAVLYVTRGAFHNPTRDEARLAGLVTVAGSPRQEDPALSIAGREFAWSMRIRPDVILPEREGPAVRPLAPRLSLVRKPASWGAYFRPSPVEISDQDFELLADAVVSHQAQGEETWDG